MARPLENIAHACRLDDAPAVHDRDAPRDFGHDAEIVRHQNGRRARRRLAPGQQRQHLRLHRDVEGRGRLVGDDQLRLAGHRHGDDGALAHAPGELVRILLDARFGGRDLDLAQG